MKTVASSVFVSDATEYARQDTIRQVEDKRRDHRGGGCIC